MRWVQLMAVWLLLVAPAVAQAACTSIAVTNLAFGTYTGLLVTSSAAMVTVNCTSGYAYQIALGQGAGASTAARAMISGGGALSYGVYRDAAHSQNWGNNAGVDTVGGTGNGSAQIYTIYAQLPPGQYVTPGNYTDTMTASVTDGGPIATLNVNATVAATCTIAASNLSFGSYSGAVLDAASTLTVQCTKSTSFNIGLNPGMATGATVTTRQMQGANGALVSYGLFRDTAHTLNWGQTVGADTLAGQGDGAAHGYPVNGEMAAGQYVRPGLYADTITATINY